MMKMLLRFSLTMPLDAAKKARMWQMKCCSVGESSAQSEASAERSISLAVQNDASAFLYILQMLLCWMGKRTKRWGFSRRSGSGARLLFISAILCFNLFQPDNGVFTAFLVVKARVVL
jgi:hypothetical protein